MSDFDQKNIPTLDDIVDNEGAEDTETSVAKNEDNLDLFEGKISDDIIDEEIDDIKISQQSIQYAYQEIYSGSTYRVGNKTKDHDSVTSNDIVESDSTPPLETLALESIVEDVVKQMMPDLEQQLRFLIQRSLEEKLPEEIIEWTDDGSSDS